MSAQKNAVSIHSSKIKNTPIASSANTNVYSKTRKGMHYVILGILNLKTVVIMTIDYIYSNIAK